MAIKDVVLRGFAGGTRYIPTRGFLGSSVDTRIGSATAARIGIGSAAVARTGISSATVARTGVGSATVTRN